MNIVSLGVVGYVYSAVQSHSARGGSVLAASILLMIAVNTFNVIAKASGSESSACEHCLAPCGGLCV